MGTPLRKPKSTKTVELTKEANDKKLHTMDHFRDTQSLFKLKKFQSSKPRVETINKNYVPPSNYPYLLPFLMYFF